MVRKYNNTDYEDGIIPPDYISAFAKKCDRCGDIYNDYLENMICCKSCKRNEKIDKILKD